MLCLGTTRRLQGWYRVSIGGMSCSTADVRVIATVAIHCTAAHVILAHNHPGGTLHPSLADIQLTDQVHHGLGLLNISLQDHLIITADAHLSMRDAGYFCDLVK